MAAMTSGLPSRAALFAVLALTVFAAVNAAHSAALAGCSAGILLAAGVCGVVLAILCRHPYRALGLIAPLLTAWAVSAAVGWITSAPPAGVIYILAGALGSTFAAIALYRGYFSKPGEWNWFLLGLILAVPLYLYWGFTPVRSKSETPDLTLGLGRAAPLLAIAAVVSWLRLFRPFFELASEPVLWLMYAVRGTGPALTAFPPRRPCIVVANHACWFDPIFLSKVLPRPVTAMMTSRFYDVPGIRWLMRRFGTIRVQESTFKHDAAEIGEAVAALDRGECVVVFPEGFLRRSEEKPLKRFGRGVWQILQARPDTPVFACWIEGAWGSYCSYKGGPPTKNKKPDFRRPIAVAVAAAVTVDADTLKDHLATRVFLMNRVLAARALLGLPEVPPVVLPTHDADELEAGPQPA
jgi:1-acyl-sn-glycerol-3-phosphate acyltransferase